MTRAKKNPLVFPLVLHLHHGNVDFEYGCFVTHVIYIVTIFALIFSNFYHYSAFIFASYHVGKATQISIVIMYSP